MNIFEDFKQYLSKNCFKIESLTETSIRGINGEKATEGFIMHLFFDYKYDDYVLHVSDKGYKLWASIFKPLGDGYELNHEDDNRQFKNLQEIIDYTYNSIADRKKASSKGSTAE